MEYLNVPEREQILKIVLIDFEGIHPVLVATFKIFGDALIEEEEVI